MAIIKPVSDKRKYKDIQEGQNICKSAERIVCQWVEESIGDDLFGGTVRGIINRPISGREPDMVLAIPNYGILVIEIKAYTRKFIKTYTDDGEILCHSEEQPIRKHPYDQAKEFVFTLMNAIKKKHPDFVAKRGKCCVVPLVAMPNMSREEYMELGLDTPYDIEGTLTSDWLDNKDTFQTKFKEAIEFAFGRAKGAEFDAEYYDKAVQLIWPEWTKEVSNQETTVEEVLKPSLGTGEESTCEDRRNRISETKIIRLTGEDILKELKKAQNSKNKKAESEEPWDYSRVYLLNGLMPESTILGVAKTAIEERKRGTKIIMHCMHFDDQLKVKLGDVFKKHFDDAEALNDLAEYRPAEKNDWNTFLFEIHFLDEINNEVKTMVEAIINDNSDVNKFPVLCRNGEDITRISQSIHIHASAALSSVEDSYWKILNMFGAHTAYNHEQFVVEHCGVDKNILVTAGAGTGKTFSMTGRVAFLAHFNILNGPENFRISDMIYMMTFTNNSTDEMRKRISGHFEKYYLLTNKDCYMRLLEQLGNMKIKTIDSMAKMILSKYAHIFGLSKSFSIKSGKYIKRNIVKRNVQKNLSNSATDKFVLTNNLRSYELEKAVNKLIVYISNRSIDLDGSNCKLNDERGGDNRYRDFLECVVTDSINEYHDYNINNNTLEMESIVTWLSKYKNLIKDEEDKLRKEESKLLKYLFIDEFQDTDKHQIELVAFFADLYRLKLFVVGDRKQSIYGFRGAEDTAFKELAAVSGRKFVELALKKNYRTDTQLLNEFNRVFKNKFKGANFKYEDEDKLVPQLNIIAPVNTSKDIFNMEVIDGNVESLGDKLNEFINLLKMRIKDQPTETKQKYKIAILTRTNSEIEVIRKLNNDKKYNWGIMFDTEGNFYRQDAVIDFYKLVCAMLNAENPQYIYNLSLTPYCNAHIPRGSFYREEMDRINTLADLDSKQGFPFAKYHKELRNQTGLKLLRELVKDNKPWERYLPESMEMYVEPAASDKDKSRLKQARSNYRKCLDQLFQLLIERNGADYITLNQIKNSLEICITTKQPMELYQDIKQGSDTNENNKVDIEIVCTTVHKSKGLEYRSVILPFTTSDIGKVAGNVLIMDQDIGNINYVEYCLKKKDNYLDKYSKPYYESKDFGKCKARKEKDQTAEELRILYVAMTRAKCEFYFIINDNERNELIRNDKEFWGKYLQ